MNHRVMWPVLGVAGLLGLVVAVSITSAQRPIPMPYTGMPGRFVVAHASATTVVLVDTSSGQVYRVNEKEFKTAADLAKLTEPMRPPMPIFPKDGPRPIKDGPDIKERPPIREIKDRPPIKDRRPDRERPREDGRERPPVEKEDR